MNNSIRILSLIAIAGVAFFILFYLCVSVANAFRIAIKTNDKIANSRLVSLLRVIVEKYVLPVLEYILVVQNIFFIAVIPLCVIVVILLLVLKSLFHIH